MMNMTLGIRQRVLVITLLPLSMITLLLGGYFISTRLDDAQTALIEKGKSMSEMMASSAEFGLLVGNTEILQGLIRSATKSSEVDDVVFLNPAFEVIARKTYDGRPLEKEDQYPLYRNDQVHFLHPVVATGVDIIDSPELAVTAQEPELIGWVVVMLSEKPTQARQFEILTKGIILALIGLLGTLFIASRFGQRITNPILGLTHVIEMLQHGHLETRASLSNTGELRSLAQGINRLAQRVQESNQNLESRVDKATKRLRSTLLHLERKNQALNKASQRAAKANLAKDEFLARMSHELRTPLTSVSGFARLLDQTDLKPEQKEYTRIINLTSGLLLSIIDDILDYSKLESNAISLESIPFELCSCIQDVLEMQTASAHEKGLELVSLIEPGTPNHLMGDPVRLRQVLTNLVSNAVKFTAQGHVVIKVAAHNVSATDTHLTLQVIDSGTGIPQEQIANLFKAFSQADTSITRRYGGSGLGLVIAKRLTELMGGEIKLSSEVNSGTCVRLQIPFSLSAQTFTQPDLHDTEVLVFDNSPLVREGLAKQLAVINCRAIEFDTEEAFLKYSHEHPDIPLIWGLQTHQISPEKITSIQALRAEINGIMILLCGQPLPLFDTKRIIQIRKPPRTQLLLNALAPEPSTEQDSLALEGITIPGSPKVLIAEDNNFNRLLLRRILERAGARVAEARTGEEAIQQAIQHSPDIILMDVHMPVMDGIEATRQIRLTQTQIPIIALTANIVSSEHQRLQQAGVNHILLKPINDKELCRSITQTLSDEAVQADHIKDIQPGDGTALNRYDISSSELEEELNTQLQGLLTAFEARQIKQLRHHSHQLLGLAGLYEMPELEVAGNNLHEALHNQDYKLIWKALWQVQRLITSHAKDSEQSGAGL